MRHDCYASSWTGHSWECSLESRDPMTSLPRLEARRRNWVRMLNNRVPSLVRDTPPRRGRRASWFPAAFLRVAARRRTQTSVFRENIVFQRQRFWPTSHHQRRSQLTTLETPTEWNSLTPRASRSGATFEPKGCNIFGNGMLNNVAGLNWGSMPQRARYGNHRTIGALSPAQQSIDLLD